jgi:hypothetical protein
MLLEKAEQQHQQVVLLEVNRFLVQTMEMATSLNE